MCDDVVLVIRFFKFVFQGINFTAVEFRKKRFSLYMMIKSKFVDERRKEEEEVYSLRIDRPKSIID